MSQSTDDCNTTTDNIYINEADGLPNEHPTLPELNADQDGFNDDENETFGDLPKSIIVTNLHSEIFINDLMKQELEDLFRSFSETATFQWLKSFRRLRVNFESAISAANARLQLHQYPFYKSTINCYFAQPLTPISARNLQPPPLTKQFLISPPPSPPAGWEPREENEPLINHDLLVALANLSPGESHEVHASTEDQPAIIVHTALHSATGLLTTITTTTTESTSITDDDKIKQIKIQQTRCPERT